MKGKTRLKIDGPKGEDLLYLYREELRRLYGNEIADKSYLAYHRGWYYIIIARRHSDGSVGTGGWQASCYRHRQVWDMWQELKRREPKDEA